LKIFTLLPLDGIGEVIAEHHKAPERRVAQRTLAEEVVTLVHRAEIAQKCIFQTAALYPGPRIANSPGASLPNFRADLILQAFRGDDAMLKRLPSNSIIGMPLSRLLRSINLVKSYSMNLQSLCSCYLGEGIRAVQAGGVYVNGVQQTDINTLVRDDLLLDGKVMIIRYGKSHFKIIEIMGEEDMEYDTSSGI
jgi:tyrosyl-tRNA synthetase